MATTYLDLNDPKAVQVWSRRLFAEAINGSLFIDLSSKDVLKTPDGREATLPRRGDRDSVTCLLTDLERAPGSAITTQLRAQLVGDGVRGDDVLEGREEGLRFHHDTLIMGKRSHAVRFSTGLAQQRSMHAFRPEAYEALRSWMTEVIDTEAFWALGGYTPGYSLDSPVRSTDTNPVTPPTAGRHLMAGRQTEETDLTVTDTFDLTMLDAAVARAKTQSISAGTGPKFRPIRQGGRDYFLLILHPFQVRQLRAQRDGLYQTLEQALLQGGLRREESPLFNGAVGMYNSTIIHESERVPMGVDANGDPIPEVRRGLFLGAHALTMAFGRDSSSSTISWNESEFDYGRSVGVAASMTYALKKTAFADEANNRHDYASMVLSSYASSEEWG